MEQDKHRMHVWIRSDNFDHQTLILMNIFELFPTILTRVNSAWPSLRG